MECSLKLWILAEIAEMHAYFKIPKIQRRSAVLWVKILIAVRMARCCGKVMSVVSPAEMGGLFNPGAQGGECWSRGSLLEVYLASGRSGNDVACSKIQFEKSQFSLRQMVIFRLSRSGRYRQLRI